MQRNTTLDISRAISILLIVGYWHVFDYFKIKPDARITENSFQFVTSALALFIYLSGYFLGKYKIENLVNATDFYKKRLIRFYTLFFLSALSMWAIGMFPFTTLITSLLGISPYWLPQPPTLWFICMLLGFYLITPLVLVQKNRVKRLMVSGLIYLVIFLFHRYVSNIDERVLMYFPFFILGIVTPKEHFMNEIMKLKYLFISGILFSIILYFNIHRVHILTYFCSFTFVNNLIGVCFILALSNLIDKITFLKPLLLKISYASMAIYLFHRQIYYLFIQVLPSDLSLQILYFGVIVIPITFVIAYFIQVYYDKFEHRIKTRNEHNK
jgi:surface polysaccharide O-acyltransferase-like enzyme